MIKNARKIHKDEQTVKLAVYKHFNGDIHRINVWYLTPNKALKNKCPIKYIHHNPSYLLPLLNFPINGHTK